ncbi:hypothetical protein [Micrococcus sp.]|uniref:MinD/ParA family ATP-binding protein n=1 Tax=Micrococcus sp. TaxID=1271 RepID=UPI0026DD4D27|nr:hypothetical protein [Micrococcus sp.]MDO4239915.1 hypothetical protein [Micrococcus sp.]
MKTTLHLTGQVTLTDSTGTRLPATDLDTALATVAKARTGRTPVVTVTGQHEGLTIDRDTWRVNPDGDLSPAPQTTTPAYKLAYSAFTLTDPSGTASPVQTPALATIAQSAADRLGHEVIVDSDLPGVVAQSYLPSQRKPAHAEVTTSMAETFATRTRPDKRRQSPARQGWRGALNEAFGLKLAPSADEMHARELTTTIQRGLPGHRTAVVVNIKGGASKTTATYLLSATLGRVRGGTVLAWDNNENAGNLADRALPASHQHTAVDLLANIEDFRTPEHADKLTGYVRPQGDNRFHVLASQDHAGDREVIDADAFRQMHAVLRQHYSLAIVDTGNASTAATWRAAVDVADSIVVAITNKEDAARRAFVTIDALRKAGHGDKLARSIAVVTQPAEASTDRLDKVRELLAEHVGAVVVIPFDPALDEGDEIDWDRLSKATRRAYLEAAAALIEGLS